MNKTAHTPGPWEYFGPLKYTVYGGDPKRRIAVVDFMQGNPTDESEANARLIAAGPTMYDYIEKKANGGDQDAARILAAIRNA